jgi:carbonic anhydrase
MCRNSDADMARILIWSLVALVGVISADIAVESDSGGWTYRSGSPDCDGTPNNLCSPPYWGNLYPQCDGRVQSPINLAEAVHNDLIQPPEFKSLSGGCKRWQMGASTTSFSAEFSASGCYNLTMTFQGIRYYLEQLHFHSPSEHTIGGGTYSAEAHLIHRSFDSYEVFLLVGIFLDVTTTKHAGTNNTFLNTLWNLGGQTLESICKSLSVAFFTLVDSTCAVLCCAVLCCAVLCCAVCPLPSSSNPKRDLNFESFEPLCDPLAWS